MAEGSCHPLMAIFWTGKLHYKGGNPRAIMQKLGENTDSCLILAKTVLVTQVIYLKIKLILKINPHKFH